MDIQKIRADFPILAQQVNGKNLVYLDNAATTQKPQVVIDTMSRFYRETNSNIHRGVHTLSERASQAYERSRQTVQSFINAKSSKEIIFTSGTTASVNLLASALGQAFIREGDEIIVSEMEHHSNFVPWQILCEQKGAKLKVIPLKNNGTLDMAVYQRLLNKKTRLVAIAFVSNTLGTINPVKEIIRLAHTQDVPVLLDGAQAIPHIKIDVQDLDCDFFAFSGHKIYADTGIGVLYGKEARLEKLPPWQTGGGMIEHVSIEKTTWNEIPFRFEAGTPHYVGAVSLSAALDYVSGTGIQDIASHEQELYNHMLQLLQDIPGLEIYGQSEQRCGALSFNLSGLHPYDVGMILDKLGVAVRTGTHCAETVMRYYGINGTLRASLGMYNTQEDIRQLAEGILRAQKMLS